MMSVPDELEVVSHEQVNHLKVFFVRMHQRTPHLHRDMELALVADGEVALRLADGPALALGQDEGYLAGPLQVHELAAAGEALILAVQMSAGLGGGALRGVSYGSAAPLRACFKSAPARYNQLVAVCAELAWHYFSRGPGYQLKCVSLAGLLQSLLYAHLPHRPLSEQARHSRATARLLSITDYIDENFRRKLLLGEIAEREGLTLTHLSHFLKAALGMTFQDYLAEKRFEYACNLLETSSGTILDISVESGFSDARYFSRLFARRYGATPAEYRKRQGVASQAPRLVGDSLQNFFSPTESLALLAPLRQRARAAGGCNLWELYE